MKGGERMRSGLLATFFRICGQVSFFFIVECSTSNSKFREKSNMCEPGYVETVISRDSVKFKSTMLKLQKIKAIGGELWIGFTAQIRARARNSRFVETTICRRESIAADVRFYVGATIRGI